MDEGAADAGLRKRQNVAGECVVGAETDRTSRLGAEAAERGREARRRAEARARVDAACSEVGDER